VAGLTFSVVEVHQFRTSSRSAETNRHKVSFLSLIKLPRNQLATQPEDQDELAELTHEQLREALRSCREQLAKAEAVLNKSRQDNQPPE
jgi:hypothetical protein